MPYPVAKYEDLHVRVNEESKQTYWFCRRLVCASSFSTPTSTVVPFFIWQLALVFLIARLHTSLSIFGQFESVLAFATSITHQIANTMLGLSALGLA